MTPRQIAIAVPPEVRAALTPLVEWIVTLAIETAIKHTKGTEGPRYYDAKTAPMGKTAFLRLAAQGAFPSFKVGKRIRARADDVHMYMEAQQGARQRAPRASAIAPPVDLNELSPAEIAELNLTRALPKRDGNHIASGVDWNALSPADAHELRMGRPLPARQGIASTVDVNALSPAEILALPLTRSVPTRRGKRL